jgi:hypothetical protein
MGGGGFLGLGPAPSAPAAPDYAAAARETAQGNLAASQSAAAANRVNQVTPYGNLNYTQTKDAEGNPVWTATTSLSDVGQQLLNNQNQSALGLGSTTNAALRDVQNTMGQPFNPNLPALQSNLATPTYNQVGQGPGFDRIGQGPQFSQMGSNPQLQTGLDFQGMEGWDKATSLINQRLQPQIQQSEERLQAQLANQGIAPGTEAYNRAMAQQGQKTNDLLTQAQLAGQNVQQNMFGQALQGGQFGNQALNQMNANQLANLGFNNATGQQGFANTLAGTQINNAANQQGFANQLAGNQANNAALAQGFANQATNAGITNAANQQAFNQQMTQYNMPLNTLSALRTGSQVQNPSFINAPQQATTSGADILGASQMGYNAQMGDFNQKQAAQQNFNQGLMGLGAAGLPLLSDIRTKENIKQIHWLPNGLPVYEYEYKPEWKDEAGHGKFIGVMAQDVIKVQPNAIVHRDDGYMMVNYGALNE